jgi:starch-binding outer membrane protein, SusD/RagB family
MKKIMNYIIFLALPTCLMLSCHDVDVSVTSELTPDAYPLDSAQFVTASGPAYSALRGNFALDYFFMQTLSTDEAIFPARGGNWYDGKKYLELHYHTWTLDNAWTNSCWTWLGKTISTTNQILSILSTNEPDGSYKNTNLAEIRMVRALAYFMMMDVYGNVPLDTVYGDFTPRDKSPRTQVFNYIEKEANACLPYLSTSLGEAKYGIPTKYMAWALLAKLYINAEYYTGTQRYNDCIAVCDSIISSGKYSLATRSEYLAMFYPDNGPTTPEFIFAIPYDPAATAMSGTNGYMYRARYDVPRSEKAKFSLPFTPSGPESTLPEFYAHFYDSNDIRNGQWLTGLQYLSDGVTPVTVTTTLQGYNQFYTGDDKDNSYTYQVNLTPDIILREDSALFDCGNDEISWNMGYRNIKFYPDNTSTSRNQNNDVPVFRYSDIILMKAEAILRGGSATLGQTALLLVNELRAQRSTSIAWTTVTLDSIYSERSREFAMETWHRNDMIRFGKYEGKWGFKTNAETYRRIFPIPTYAFTVNSAITQNDGY